jgi:predicted nucleic acid-binding protein
VIYLDASAIVTAVTLRNPAPALREYLEERPDERTCTNTIGFVETVRTCDLIGSFPNLMTRLRADHTEIPLSARVRDEAARLPGVLRSLDAIHVATAALLGPHLTGLVTYDRRMADAARGAGLPVTAPGLR